MKVNIIRLDNFGRGIAYYNNKICFINNALPLEEVDFEIVRETSKYIEGNMSNIIKKSSDRIKSKCPYSSLCGGCCFQEYDYFSENKYKEDKIRSLVEKVLLLDSNVVNSIVYDVDYNYRNKIVLHGDSNDLGLYKIKSNEIIDIDYCLISNKKINNIISILKNIKGIDEVLIRTSNDLSSVIIDIKGDISEYKELEGICDVLIINNKYISKNKNIITNIGNKKYYLSSNSFFQVNGILINKLFDKVLEYVKRFRPSKVLDLYCGTGSFGIYISEYVKEIVGVDYNKSNIEDANRNKVLNNIDNIEYVCDKVENVIDKYDNYDMVIVDPPRAGLDNNSCNYLLKMSPKYIIYISCDPNTLIRDLKLLINNYELLEITPYNLFPRTYHCEALAVLVRK